MRKLTPKIYINTDKYYHSRQPQGYGSWGFEIAGAVRFFNGQYSQAKQKAVAEAKKVAREKGSPQLVITLLP